MLPILHDTPLNIKYQLSKIEKLLCRYELHKEKYPKRMHLKFNLNLCSSDEFLKEACRKILDSASFSLQNVIARSVESKIKHFKKERTR